MFCQIYRLGIAGERYIREWSGVQKHNIIHECYVCANSKTYNTSMYTQKIRYVIRLPRQKWYPTRKFFITQSSPNLLKRCVGVPLLSAIWETSPEVLWYNLQDFRCRSTQSSMALKEKLRARQLFESHALLWKGKWIHIIHMAN